MKRIQIVKEVGRVLVRWYESSTYNLGRSKGVGISHRKLAKCGDRPGGLVGAKRPDQEI